jgi:hypothetical protein
MMKRTIMMLLASLALALTQTAVADIGDYQGQMVKRFKPNEPVKAADVPGYLQGYVVAYHVRGAYYFEAVITAPNWGEGGGPSVVKEAIWCSDKSAESPEHVVERLKRRLEGDAEWASETVENVLADGSKERVTDWVPDGQLRDVPWNGNFPVEPGTDKPVVVRRVRDIVLNAVPHIRMIKRVDSTTVVSANEPVGDIGGSEDDVGTFLRNASDVIAEMIDQLVKEGKRP